MCCDVSWILTKRLSTHLCPMSHVPLPWCVIFLHLRLRLACWLSLSLPSPSLPFLFLKQRCLHIIPIIAMTSIIMPSSCQGPWSAFWLPLHGVGVLSFLQKHPCRRANHLWMQELLKIVLWRMFCRGPRVWNYDHAKCKNNGRSRLQCHEYAGMLEGWLFGFGS